MNRRTPLAAFAAALALLATASVARADTAFTTEQLLKDFFRTSSRVTYKRLPVSQDEREILSRRLGYPFTKSEVVVFVALTGEKVDGYAVIDEEMGEHLPITFGVKVTPAGVLERSEIMVYRETYGGEVREPRFRDQFLGKTAADPLRVGGDVVVISGATISSNAITRGVKRALVVVDELVLRPASRAAQLTTPRTQGT